MNQTALIWTLAIMSAVLCMLLAIDLIFRWRNNCRKAKAMKRNAEMREREALLRMCTEKNKLGTCAEPVRVDAVEIGSTCARDVEDAVPYGYRGGNGVPARAVTARRDPTGCADESARDGLHAESSHPTKILRCAQNDTEKSNVVNGIDLCGRERPVFEVKLPPDGKILHLLTPTKAVSDRFQAIGALLERQEQHRLSMDGVEQLFKFAAILVSNNKECYVFTPADLKERLTSEDIGLLLQSYLVWLTETIQSLN